jgi:hypothetical protein
MDSCIPKEEEEEEEVILCSIYVYWGSNIYHTIIV